MLNIILTKESSMKITKKSQDLQSASNQDIDSVLTDASSQLSQKVEEYFGYLNNLADEQISEFQEFISRPKDDVLSEIQGILKVSKEYNGKNLIRKYSSNPNDKKLERIHPLLSQTQLDRYNKNAPSVANPSSWPTKVQAIYRFFMSPNEPLGKKACFYGALKNSNATITLAPAILLVSINELLKEGFFTKEGLKAAAATGVGLVETMEEQSVYVASSLSSALGPCMGAFVSTTLNLLERIFMNYGTKLLAWLFDGSGDESWKEEYAQCLPGYGEKGIKKGVGIMKRTVIKTIATTTLRMIPIIGETLARISTAKPAIDVVLALYDKWITPYEAAMSLEQLPVFIDDDKSNKSLDKLSYLLGKDVMINKRLASIAKYLGDKELYKEAAEITKLIKRGKAY